MPAQPNPYDTLGVDPDADEATIRAAYRDRAKETHPDTENGSVDAFAQLGTALAVLTNPQKRKKFDDTGKLDDSLDTTEQAALNIIGAILSEALSNESHDPNELDLVTVLTGAIEASIAEIEDGREPSIRAVARARKMIARFKGKRAPSFIQMVKWHIERLDSSIERATRAITERKRALEIIADVNYEWDMPIPQAPQGMQRANTTSYGWPSTVGGYEQSGFNNGV